jgi:hypothetical protein
MAWISGFSVFSPLSMPGAKYRFGEGTASRAPKANIFNQLDHRTSLLGAGQHDESAG